MSPQPRHRPFPSPLETERLIVRTPAPQDAEAVNEAILESLENLRPWMPWAQQAPTVAESREYCESVVAATSELRDFALFAFDKLTGKFILASGCHLLNPDVPSCHIGYWCRVSEQGKGYVTEAVHAIQNAAFDTMGMRRVEIRCDVKNERSIAVAMRCGFPLEATLRRHSRDPVGELRDTHIFALTREDE